MIYTQSYIVFSTIISPILLALLLFNGKEGPLSGNYYIFPVALCLSVVLWSMAYRRKCKEITGESDIRVLRKFHKTDAALKYMSTADQKKIFHNRRASKEFEDNQTREVISTNKVDSRDESSVLLDRIVSLSQQAQHYRDLIENSDDENLRRIAAIQGLQERLMILFKDFTQAVYDGHIDQEALCAFLSEDWGALDHDTLRKRLQGLDVRDENSPQAAE